MDDGQGQTTVQILESRDDGSLLVLISSQAAPTVAMTMSPRAAARLAGMLLEAARRADFASVFCVGEEN